MGQVSGQELKKLCEDINECYSENELLRCKVEEKIQEIEKREEALDEVIKGCNSKDDAQSAEVESLIRDIEGQEKLLRTALEETLELEQWERGPLKEIWGPKKEEPQEGL